MEGERETIQYEVIIRIPQRGIHFKSIFISPLPNGGLKLGMQGSTNSQLVLQASLRECGSNNQVDLKVGGNETWTVEFQNAYKTM